MKNYWINKFVPITMDEDGVFVGIDIKNSYSFQLNESQEKIFSNMLDGKEFEYEKLKEIFSEELLSDLIKKNIFVEFEQDISSCFSRTKAFYDKYFNKKTFERLQKSNVLILGCGGLGTHIAWNLVTMGVGNFTLVDGDCVEISNLNRQILFTVDDVGIKKVHILERQLSKIASGVNIETIDSYISSKEELEKIINSNKFDLIIKTLDRPLDFPIWLDDIALKKRLKYISAIDSESFCLLGPSYLGTTTCGYTDFFDKIENYDKYSGIAPSISIQHSHAGAEVAMEAINILLERDNLKYVNKIHYVDITHDLSMDMEPKNKNKYLPERTASIWNPLMLGMFCLLIMSLFNIPFLFYVGFLLVMMQVLIDGGCFEVIIKKNFINQSIYLLLGMVSVVISNEIFNAIDQAYVFAASIFTLFVLYSLFIFVSSLIVSVVYKLICLRRS